MLPLIGWLVCAMPGSHIVIDAMAEGMVDGINGGVGQGSWNNGGLEVKVGFTPLLR